jgi:hypothetical protein
MYAKPSTPRDHLTNVSRVIAVMPSTWPILPPPSLVRLASSPSGAAAVVSAAVTGGGAPPPASWRVEPASR